MSGHCDYCLRCDAPEVLDVQITYYSHKWYAITLCKNCRKYLFGRWRYEKRKLKMDKPS